MSTTFIENPTEHEMLIFIERFEYSLLTQPRGKSLIEALRNFINIRNREIEMKDKPNADAISE